MRCRSTGIQLTDTALKPLPSLASHSDHFGFLAPLHMQMHTVSLPWRDASQEYRLIQGDRLAFEPNAHAWLALFENLAVACMSYDAEDRPRNLSSI